MRPTEKHSPTLSSVDSELRKPIKRIIKQCKVTPQQAYQSLLLNDLSTERAISSLKSYKQIPNNTMQNQVYESMFNFQQKDFGMNEDESDEEYLPYLRFQLDPEKLAFYQRYPIPLSILRKPKNQERYQSELFLQLSKLLDKKWIPKSRVSSFEEALCLSYQQCIPVLVLMTDLNRQILRKIKELLTNGSNFKEKMENQFIYFDIIDKKWKPKSWQKEFINPEKSINCLSIFRINIYDEIQIQETISLNKSIEEIRQELKKIKAKSICRYLDEKNLRMKHRMKNEGKYWRRPKNYKQKSIEKQIKLANIYNQQIRKEQEEAFQELANQTSNNQAIQLLKQKEKKNTLEERQKMRKKLTIYEQGFTFKIRVPSGQNLLVTVSEEEKIQYLYQFIESREQKLGFQDESVRNFDLIVGLGEGKNLKGKQDSKISEIFKQGELLVVKEID